MTAKRQRSSINIKPSKGTPAALCAFMLRDWQAHRRQATPPVQHWRSFAARRRRLAAAFPGEILIVPSGQEKARNADAVFRFRASSDFYYLTGCTEPDCVLVLVPKKDGRHEHWLFVTPSLGRRHPSFFTDRMKGELWVGPRLGVAQSRARYRVDRCLGLPELAAILASYAKKRRKRRVVRGIDVQVEREAKTLKRCDGELAAQIAEMRLCKEPAEVSAIVRGAKATKTALDAVIVALRRASSERDLEGVFDAHARVGGNGVGYSTIVAAGSHACTLHWTRNDGRLRRGELVLVDAGVETNELYTADVTRTLPIGGRFDTVQRQIYDLVLEAHAAALAAVKPGNDFSLPHREASRVLARGLIRLGILRVELDTAIHRKNQFYRRYTLHGVSHMLGLDVHDCDRARPRRYRRGKLQAGMVLTIEPGLYFQPDDLTVPRRYRGLGIRVEDDILVTARGYRILTDIPRTSTEVEQWMRSLWTPPRKQAPARR